MKISNELNEYDNNLIPSKHKLIFKYSIIFSVAIILALTIATFFYLNFYKCIIGFVLGSIGSIVLFYKTHVIVKSTHYIQYKKMIKKLHIMYQITYIVLFAIILLLLKSFIAIVSLAIGLLMIKLTAFIVNLFKERNKN